MFQSLPTAVKLTNQCVTDGSFTRLSVVIEIFTRMSYIASVGQNLGLGFSGLYLQTSWQHTDIKISVIDNGASLVKGLPVMPCVIEIVLGFGRTRNCSE